MNEKLAVLLAKIHELETDVLTEIQKKEKQFGYTVQEKKVHFIAAIEAQNKKLAQKWASYIRKSKLFNLLTAPVIWSCVFPVLFFDLVVTFYQFLAFRYTAFRKCRAPTTSSWTGINSVI